MLLSAFIARIGLGIVQPQGLAVLGDFLLSQIGVRRIDFDILIRSRRHGFRHRIDKARAAVGIDGVVAGMVGNHHAFQAVALSDARSNGQHDAVTKRHHRRLHVLVIVVAFGDVVGRHQQGTLEVTVHEFQRNNDVLDTQSLTMRHGTDTLATILGRAIVKGDGQGDFVLELIEHRGRVHAAGDDDYCVLHFSF